MEKAEKLFRQSNYTDMMDKLIIRDRALSFDDSTIPKWYEFIMFMLICKQPKVVLAMT